VATFSWPPPAEQLHAVRRDDDVVAVAPITALARVHRTAGAHPSRWDELRQVGPVATARFDPHPPTADGRPAWLVVFNPARALRLLDLTGTWPTRAGASQAISSGPRDRARAWARAIFSAYDDIDGLWYRSAMDAGRPAVCLWEPARDALPEHPRAHLPLDAPALALPIARACRTLGYRWI
jgi:hypothetical protein